MKPIAPVYFASRAKWRAWLKKHHATSDGIWLLYYKKHTGKLTVAYSDAVEEALCFGWIDSRIQRIDDESYAQWYSPRRKGSSWSDLNRQRVQAMLEAGLMTDAGLAVYDEHARRCSDGYEGQALEVPSDLKKALSASKTAAENFGSLPPKYIQIALRWILAAKRPETRAKRIAEFVQLTAAGKRLGMK